MFVIVDFILRFFRKAVDIFSAVPSKVAVLVAGISAIVGECVTFVNQITDFFNARIDVLDTAFSNFARLTANSQLFSLFSYCLSFDTLVGIVASVAAFTFIVLSFLFVGFLHVVLIFFGLKFGYMCFKFMLKVFSNGLAH